MLVVGLTPDYEPAAEGRHSDSYVIRTPYVEMVQRSGALPMLLPYSLHPEAIGAYLERIDALVVTGGYFDVPAELYGETSGSRMGAMKPMRTSFELSLIRGAMERSIPLLGVCGGMQLLNVACGGTLHQDILEEIPGASPHEQGTDPRKPAHDVEVTKGSRLAACVGNVSTIAVNSTHHQAVKVLGRNLMVSGRAPDGVIEAIEDQSRPFVLGVQWHPELLAESDRAHQAICDALVKVASS